MTKKTHFFESDLRVIYFGTYNRATWKRMMGQTTNRNVLNLIVGSLIMLYGVLLITDGIHKIWVAQTIGELAKALIFLASTAILFGTTILLQTVRTMRLFTGKRPSLQREPTILLKQKIK